jgi:hypothetical protein
LTRLPRLTTVITSRMKDRPGRGGMCLAGLIGPAKRIAAIVEEFAMALGVVNADH